MKILVDGDSCPILNKISKIAKENDVELLIVCDNVHDLDCNYGEVLHVDCGRDSADFAIVNRTEKGDVVITHDAGLAAMAMAKGAHCVHHNGMVYSKRNINQLLTNRYFRVKSNKKRARGMISGQTKKENLEKLISKWISPCVQAE